MANQFYYRNWYQVRIVNFNKEFMPHFDDENTGTNEDFEAQKYSYIFQSNESLQWTNFANWGKQNKIKKGMNNS